MATLALSPIGHELLDDPGADPALVTESFRHLARANRWFGGAAALQFGLRRLLQGARGTFTLLDIGTGSGDLPRRAERWGRRHGVQLRPVGLERSLVAARLAQQRGVPCVVGCAGNLPFTDGTVDIVIMSQLLHHLSRGAASEVVRRATRIARLGVVVADLRRSGLAALGFRFASGLLRFDAETRADGITSLRRGYQPAELAALLRDAGVRATVHRRPGSRLVAAWRTA